MRATIVAAHPYFNQPPAPFGSSTSQFHRAPPTDFVQGRDELIDRPNVHPTTTPQGWPQAASPLRARDGGCPPERTFDAGWVYTRAFGVGAQMLKIGSIVWGVRDVPRAIEFWSAALGYRPLRKPSPDWAILIPAAGEGVQLAISQISSNAEDHQRHHLDLYAADRTAEVERLLALGARRVDWRYPDCADYVVLADPDGNKFCVIQK